MPASDPKGIGGKMGEIVAVEADGFTVVCADGRFKVTRVQADGPKVGAGEFAGPKAAAGSRLTELAAGLATWLGGSLSPSGRALGRGEF